MHENNPICHASKCVNSPTVLDLLQEEFEDHAEKAKTLPETTTNENKLILYGLFKQATVGPVNTSKHLAQITCSF